LKYVDRFVARNIVCPGFYVLKPNRGCSFECCYCYLTRTFRRLATKKNFVMYPIELVKKQLVKVMEEQKKPQVFNAGELSDSLEDTGWLDEIVPMFENSIHMLLLLTKSDKVEWFTNNKPLQNVVFSMTWNTQQFIDRYEKGTPGIDERERAIRIVHNSGWRTRVRIDPIGYEPLLELDFSDYVMLAEDIRNYFGFIERVTLGTWRFYPTDKAWFKETEVEKIIYTLCENEKADKDGRKRVRYVNRLKDYKEIAEKLVPIEVGLCKETVEMHQAMRDLGLIKRVKCNCTL